MAQLFKRAVRVIAGPLQIEGLRVQFKIKKTSKKEPNEALVSIFNLSKDSRSKLSDAHGTRLIIEAGYTDTLEQVFSGDAKPVDHVHDGPDWITKLQCGDGERAYRYQLLAESFKSGTSVADVFAKVADATGLDVTDAVKLVRSEVKEQFTKGYSAHGPASAEIDRLLKGRGLTHSVQDGKLQVLKLGVATSETVIELSADTGMVGSPEHGSSNADRKAQILRVKSLLQPGLRPGRKLRVKSEAISGDFVAQTVEHEGDTAGGAWYSTVEALPL